MTDEQGRGVDTRFRRDAIVLVAVAVQSYHELQQMVGRSSRSRGVCEGILYNIGHEKPVQVMDRLKRQNATKLQDLEQWMEVVEKRSKDIAMIKHLTEQRDNCTPVRSLAQLQAAMPPATYLRIIKQTLL